MNAAARTLSGLLLGTLLHAGTDARAQAELPADYALVSGESVVSFHVVHKLHKVDGESKEVEGKARVLASGAAQVVVRARAASFVSGNVNRDAHVKEVIEAERYPLVEVKAVCENLGVPASFPATIDKTCKAKISLHGVQLEKDIAVKLVYESATQLRATSSFELSLEAFKIERPSLMFVKVNDALRIDASAVFVRM